MKHIQFSVLDGQRVPMKAEMMALSDGEQNLRAMMNLLNVTCGLAALRVGVR